MKTYHPERDSAQRYLDAAQNEQNPATKHLLETAAGTISYLKKHCIGTQRLLAEINNEVVEALNDDQSWFTHEDMEAFLPRMQCAIETADDSNNEFSTPYESWQHLRDASADPQANNEPFFYLQDSRSFCGNDVMWWAQVGGYTSDLSKARIYTKDEAVRQHKERETDIPWTKSYIDLKARPAVDMQYINRKEALAGTGIVLIKPQRPKKETYRCNGCGQFMTEQQYYGDACSKCETWNRP
jgi:hypothetical protein